MQKSPDRADERWKEHEKTTKVFALLCYSACVCVCASVPHGFGGKSLWLITGSHEYPTYTPSFPWEGRTIFLVPANLLTVLGH